jgi:hypothetical protein
MQLVSYARTRHPRIEVKQLEDLTIEIIDFDDI